MRHVYSKSDTLQKREFVNRVFDSNLYYENGIYRTPTMLGLLSHNHLKMKEKGLMIYEKKEGLLDEAPLRGEGGIGCVAQPRTRRLQPSLWGASTQMNAVRFTLVYFCLMLLLKQVWQRHKKKIPRLVGAFICVGGEGGIRTILITSSFNIFYKLRFCTVSLWSRCTEIYTSLFLNV